MSEKNELMNGLTEEQKRQIVLEYIQSNCKTRGEQVAMSYLFSIKLPPADNSIKEFLDTNPTIINRTTTKVYLDYCNFCTEKDYSPKTKRAFVRAVNSALNYDLKHCARNNVKYTIFINPFAEREPEYNKLLADEIYKFVQSGYFKDKIPGTATAYFYMSYKSWCGENDIKPANYISFIKTFCQMSCYKTKTKMINGYRQQVFFNENE